MSSRNHFATILCGVALAGGLALSPAYALDTNVGGAVPGSTKNVCIPAHQVQDTQIIDENTILFHMTGGKTWKNTLARPCRTMSREDGIAYQVISDRLCSNLEQFHVIQTGEVCLMGEFTPD